MQGGNGRRRWRRKLGLEGGVGSWLRWGDGGCQGFGMA